MRSQKPERTRQALAGTLLGLWQAGFSWYMHRSMVPIDALPGLVSGVILLSLVWLLLSLPYLQWRCPGLLRPSRADPELPTRLFSAGLDVAAVSAAWPVFIALLTPLVPEGYLGVPAVFIIATGLSLLALPLARHLPRATSRQVRWAGSVAAFLCLGAVLATLTLASRMGSPHPQPFAPAADTRAPTNAPDVLLITVDALRADALGCYNPRVTRTPTMDRLASDGLRFARTVSPAPWTLPSLSAMLAGRPVRDTGAGNLRHRLRFAARTALYDDIDTLAERFRAGGYCTAAVVGNPWLSPFFGIDQGFTRFVNPSVQAEALNTLMELPLVRIASALLPRSMRGDDRAVSLTDTALAWLAESRDAPLFLWVHYIEPHVPWDGDPAASRSNSMLVELGGEVEMTADGSLVGSRFAAIHALRSGRIRLTPQEREKIRGLYANEVAYVDEQVGRLLASLPTTRGVPLVAFAADHGEEFWEHGGVEHAHDYHQEVTHVPLILRWPGVVPAGQVIHRTVGLIDLGATLLDLAGLPSDPQTQGEHGQSLRPLWQDPQATLPPRTCENNTFGLPSRLIAEGPWRYILRDNGQEELYRVDVDPAQRVDLAAVDVETASRLRGLLEGSGGWLESDTPAQEAAEPSADVLEGLRALGYLE